MTSILTSSKNDPYVFCSTLHGLSNAVYRFSMRCVVLEISRGGGAEINPPAGSRLAQTPAGARVKREWICCVTFALNVTGNMAPANKIVVRPNIVVPCRGFRIEWGTNQPNLRRVERGSRTTHHSAQGYLRSRSGYR